MKKQQTSFIVLILSAFILFICILSAAIIIANITGSFSAGVGFFCMTAGIVIMIGVKVFEE